MAAEKVIRKLLVRLGVKADDKALKDFDNRISALKDTARRTVDQVKWLAIGLAGLGTAALVQAKHTADAARAIENQAKVLGVSTTAYQELAFATSKYGVESQDLADAFGKVAVKATEAAGGSKSAIEQLGLLGIKVRDLKGLSPEQLFAKFADGVQKTTDPTKRLAVASQLFGDNVARKMLPMLMLGSAGIAELRAEAHELGLVLDDEAIAKSKEFSIATDILWKSVGALRDRFGLALMPALQGITDRALEWLRVNREWVREKIDQAAERIGDAFETIERWVNAANHAVEQTVGWRVIFLSIAAAIGLVAGGKGLLLVFRGLEALKALLLVFGVGAGVSFGVFVGWALLAVAVMAQLAAVVAGAFLVIDDLLTYLRGGTSVVGDFAEEWKYTSGILGSVARTLESIRDFWLEMIGLGGDLAGVIGDLGTAIATKLQPYLDAAWATLEPIVNGLASMGMTAVKSQTESVGMAAGYATQGVQSLRGLKGQGFEPRYASSSSSVSTANSTSVGEIAIYIQGDADPLATARHAREEFETQLRAASGAQRGMDR